MCQFEYYQYEQCGHKSIEITEYCNEVFWKAGMTAHLIPCPEQNFRAFFVRIGTLDGMDFGSCRWIGLAGYCKMCEEEYKMPKSIPSRTYRDYEFLEGVGNLTAPIFAVKLAEPIAYPAPSTSMRYSSTFNDGVTQEILDNEIAQSSIPPHVATPIVGQSLLVRRLKASLHHPYIFTPHINNTNAALISVEDQDIAALVSGQDKDTPDLTQDASESKGEILEIYFPPKLQWYELNQGVDGTTLQWRSRGYHEGQMMELPPSKYLWTHAGLTPADEQYVVNRLKDGVPLKIVWRDKFKERGTNFGLFYRYGRKLEDQVLEARGVRANSRMGQIQNELGERSQAADGIQPFGTYQDRSDGDFEPGHRAFQPQLAPPVQSWYNLTQQRLQQQQQQQQQGVQQQMMQFQMIRQQQQLLQQQGVQQQMMRFQMIRQHIEQNRLQMIQRHQIQQDARHQMYLQTMHLQMMQRQPESQQQPALQEQPALQQQMQQEQEVADYFYQKAPVVTVEEVEADDTEAA
ncbi:hypothetical protein SBOR_9773 [Sclerotinia borealis F-4128]|uniref:Uncharacterized protein n=1 Tax=Sclerotinia borealis (strain F-4128) TaxID=1432307 RepID=W9BZ57_SCLBF|nr:hypothetical protein SBOR_9773 [Sclerotinia borealis F-4128]